jgi:phosphatidate cytidylyltransferase
VVLLGFFLLKVYLPDVWGELAFDVLIYLFTVIGAAEMIRAFGDKLTKAEKFLVMLFAVLFIPVFAFGVYVTGMRALSVIGAGSVAIAVLMTTLLVLQYEKTTLESIGYALFCCAYPTLILSCMVMCNHLALYSDLAILFIFVISPCADSIAFVFGVTLGKKFSKPMSPAISPKKTVVGGIGGIVGGVIGAVALFFIYGAATGGLYYLQLPLYILLGAVAAVATEFGDLVESAIKRKLELKDMGKMLPGHGGVLDRIDGSIYAAIVVYVVFYVLARA